MHVSDGGGGTNPTALSGEGDRDLEHVDMRGSYQAMVAGEGGDPLKVFECVPLSVCTTGVLSWLRHDFNISDDIKLLLLTEDYNAYAPPPSHLPIHVAAFEGGFASHSILRLGGPCVCLSWLPCNWCLVSRGTW